MSNQLEFGYGFAPPIVQNRVDEVIESVREKLLQRSRVGIIKYNTTLHENNKDNYFNHLQQELMDGCNYIEKIIMQKKSISELIKQFPNDQELGEKIREIYG